MAYFNPNKNNKNNKNQSLNRSPDDLKKLIGDRFLTNNGDGDKTFKSGIIGNDIIGLFFGGQWCPSCKQFTPFLKKVHEEWKKKK